jgi:hypothetical protein
MWRYLATICFLMIAIVSGVAPQTVDFDKKAPFLGYKTYKWVNIPSAVQLDELTSGQLIGTLQVELEKKGLTRTDAENPDLYIGYQVVGEKEKDKTLKNYNIGASYGSVGGGSATGAAAMTVHSGRLVLDMYDGGKKQLIWRGVIPDPFNANAKPDQRQKHLSKSIEGLLKHYPPQKS